MDTKLISVQLRVGTTACAPAKLRRTLRLSQIQTCVGKLFKDYTLIPAKGCFNGEKEESAIVELIYVLKSGAVPEDVFGFCTRVHELMETLCKELAQRCIIASVTVHDGLRDVRWSSASSWGPPLINEPFRSPALVARYLLPESDYALASLLKETADHYRNLGAGTSGGHFINDIPELCFSPPNPITINLTGKGFPPHFESWDAMILRKSTNDLGGSADSADVGEFISLFQVISRRPAFYAKSLGTVRAKSTFAPINTAHCDYRSGIAATEGLYLETLDAWLRARRNPEAFRKYLSKRSLARLDNAPLSLIGVTVLMMTPDGKKVLIKKRGRSVGAYPGMMHLAPSGMVEPFPDHPHPSVFLTFVRELDEELFGAPELDETKERLRGKRHLLKLKGTLEFLGCGIDLMRHDLNIFLRFCPLATWWNDYKEVIRLNWEFSDAVPTLESVDVATMESKRNPDQFVPAAAAALDVSQQVGRPVRRLTKH